MASLNALDTKTLSEHRESHRMRTSLLRSLSLCLTLIVGIPVSFALDGEPPSEGVPSPLSVLSVETEIVRPVSSGMSFAGRGHRGGRRSALDRGTRSRER
jgi:hypothetical protein